MAIKICSHTCIVFFKVIYYCSHANVSSNSFFKNRDLDSSTHISYFHSHLSRLLTLSYKIQIIQAKTKRVLVRSDKLRNLAFGFELVWCCFETLDIFRLIFLHPTNWLTRFIMPSCFNIFYTTIQFKKRHFFHISTICFDLYIGQNNERAKI